MGAKASASKDKFYLKTISMPGLFFKDIRWYGRIGLSAYMTGSVRKRTMMRHRIMLRLCDYILDLVFIGSMLFPECEDQLVSSLIILGSLRIAQLRPGAVDGIVDFVADAVHFHFQLLPLFFICSLQFIQ